MPLETVAASTTTNYKTFQECYSAVLDKDAYKDNNKNAEFKAWVKDAGFSQIEVFEKELKCQGLCMKPLFFATQNFWEEPKDICLLTIRNKFKGPMRTAGYIAVLTAVISFLGFCGSFPLCTKDTEEDEQYKD